jgi:hypothetical protein
MEDPRVSVCFQTIQDRLNAGWDAERALVTGNRRLEQAKRQLGHMK